jgi:vanadium nitrogenase delta subunit
MTAPSLDDLYRYVQERCLWQFFSRAWDRTENIDGVLGTVANLLTNSPVKPNSPMERLFYTDAKILVDQLREHFPDLGSLDTAQTRSLMESLRERLTRVAITESRNTELHENAY